MFVLNVRVNVMGLVITHLLSEILLLIMALRWLIKPLARSKCKNNFLLNA